MVADALSRVSMGSVSHSEDGGEKELKKEFHRYARLGVKLCDASNGIIVMLKGSESSFIKDVKSKQDLDPSLIELKVLVKEGKIKAFSQ